LFCSRCGQKLSAGATFCPACGRQAALANTGTGGPPPQTFSGVQVAAGPQKTSGLAIASLVLGIFLFFPLSIPAIILGHIALSQIKKSAGPGSGIPRDCTDPVRLDHRRDCNSESAASTQRGERGVSGGLAQDYQHCASDLSISISHDRICSRPDVFGRQRPLYQQPSYGLSD
jgi:hypothetical protein